MGIGGGYLPLPPGEAPYQLIGVDALAYGHSYLVSAPGIRWVERFMDYSLAASFTNRGVGGTQMRQILGQIMNGCGTDPTSTWISSQIGGGKGLVFLEAVTNDMRLYGTSSIGAASWQQQAQLACWFVGSSTQYTYTSGVYSGAFSVETQGTAYDNADEWTTTAGDNITLNVTANSTGIIVLMLPAWNVAGGTWNVTVDSVAAPRLNTSSRIPTDTSGSGINVALFPYVISGLTVGAHTIVLTNGAGGGKVAFAGYLVPSSSPAQVAILVDPPLLVWNTNPPWNLGSAASSPTVPRRCVCCRRRRPKRLCCRPGARVEYQYDALRVGWRAPQRFGRSNNRTPGL